MALFSGLADPPKTDKPDEPAAQGENAPRAKPALICQYTSLVPGSKPTIAITWELRPKWHMYWPGRNDTGEAPNIDFDLPPGFTVDALQWPAPERHVESGDMLSHVYYNRLTVLATLNVPATAEPGSSVTLKAKLSWMICESVCVPEQGSVKLKLPIAVSGEQPSRSADAKHIDAARKRIPRELDKNSKDVKISWMDKTVRIEVLAASQLSFYPTEDCVPFSHPIADADANRSMLTIRLGDAEQGRTALAGILEVRRGKEDREWIRIHADPTASPGITLPKGPNRPPATPTFPTHPAPKPSPKPIP